MSMTSAPAPEVWFLTGSQGLYGPETLDQVASQSRAIADRLGDGDLPVTVVWKPVLLDAASIHRQMLDANSDPACVGVVAWMHTFSPAKMWIAGLDAIVLGVGRALKKYDPSLDSILREPRGLCAGALGVTSGCPPKNPKTRSIISNPFAASASDGWYAEGKCCHASHCRSWRQSR